MTYSSPSPTPTDTQSPAVSEAEIAELARLHAAATPGPWLAYRDAPYGTQPRVHAGKSGALIAVFGNAESGREDQWEADAVFAEAAHRFVPRLLADRKRLEEERDEANKRSEKHWAAMRALWDVLLPPHPRCRDCADFDGRCQGDGPPCDPQEWAVERAKAGIAAEAALAASQAEVEGLRGALRAADRTLWEEGYTTAHPTIALINAALSAKTSPPRGMGGGSCRWSRPRPFLTLTGIKLVKAKRCENGPTSLLADIMTNETTIGFDIRSYVDDYEFRRDDGDYSPTEAERAMLEDAIAGAFEALLARQEADHVD